MYPRILKRKNKDGSYREYVYLVEGERVNGKVVQRNIGTLGRVDTLLEGKTFENLIEKLCELKPEFREKISILNHQKELDRSSGKKYGPILIFKHLWKELGLSKTLSEYFKDKKTSFDITESVFAMVCNRLMDPSSKKETSEWIKTVYEPTWAGLELQHLYRGMDYLVEHKEKFETALYEQTQKSLDLKVDLVMFDTTSIMTWGEGAHSEILKHGLSKEKRGDLRQIMVGVLMSKEGIPMGHEVWEGNQSDKKSFAQIIQKVKSKFKLEKVILVGDRGMISRKNILALEEAGIEYILGLPMRRLDVAKKEMLLGFDTEKLGHASHSDVPGFELVKATEDGRLYAKDVTLDVEDDFGNMYQQRYVVCYNPGEAEYQAKNREFFKGILEKKAAFSTVKDWIVKNGYKKYITLASKDGAEVIATVDEDKLKKEAIYDGKWVLTTNTTADKWDGKAIARAYKGLSQIEQAFRELKSNLEVGPMYHWTSKRIRAHVFICFLALVLEIVLKKKLKEAFPDQSYSELMRDIDAIDVVDIQLSNKTIQSRARLQGLAPDIFLALGIKIPPSIL